MRRRWLTGAILAADILVGVLALVVASLPRAVTEDHPAAPAGRRAAALTARRAEGATVLGRRRPVPVGDAVMPVAPDTFDAPPAAPEPPPPVLSSPVTPSGGTWAVVVGINDYPGSHDLRAAVPDANDMVEALSVLGVPSDHVLSLRNRQATGPTIRQSVDWLSAHAAPDAVGVFFFAGHVRKLGAGREALVAADGDLLTDADLAARFSRLAARRAWFAIAACYGGGFTELLAPGRVLTAAAGAGSLAYENSRFGRSYLVQYMIRQAMIEGRALDSVQAAFAYARAALAQEYPNRQPVQVDLGAPLIDLRPPGAVARPLAPAPPAVPPAPTPRAPSRPVPAPAPTPPAPPNDGCAKLTLGLVSCT